MKKNFKDLKIVVIGGGTGTYSVLSGLKKYTDNITAVVTMADSGGSAKKERDEWGLLPTSDIRKSLLALADVSTEDSLLLRKLFQYRFDQGKGFVGMTFGNLFLVTLAKLLGSQTKAIEKAAEFLRIKGKVLPVTLDKVDLVAYYEDGTKVIGEHAIDEPKYDGRLAITSLTTEPEAQINSEVKKVILEADVIIIGPGGFYTTIIANLVIKGVAEAVSKSPAKKVYILNLMTEFGQTYKFTSSKFIKELDKYLAVENLDFILMNNRPVPRYILNRYRKVNAQPVANDFIGKTPFKVVEVDLLSTRMVKKEKADLLKRSFIRHDPDKVASSCREILNLL